LRSSFLDVSYPTDIASPPSAQSSTSLRRTSTLSRSLYRLSHIAKSTSNNRTMFGEAHALEPEIADFNRPMSTVISPSTSITSAYHSTYSQDTLKSAMCPRPARESETQSPFVEAEFPVGLGGQPGRPLIYNVESWNVGRIHVGVEPLRRSPTSQVMARTIAEDTFLEAGLLAERTGEAERLPLKWEVEHWDDSTSSFLLSQLGYAGDIEMWGPLTIESTQWRDPFDPRALPGVFQRSKPGVMVGPKAHYWSPSADLGDLIPRRRQHSGATIIQPNIPPTTPITPKFPPSGRYIPHPNETPRASARTQAVNLGSPAPSSVCLPDELLASPPDPRGISLLPSQTSSMSDVGIGDEGALLWVVAQNTPLPASEPSTDPANEASPVPLQPMLQAMKVPVLGSRLIGGTDLAHEATTSSRLPQVTISKPDNACHTPLKFRVAHHPEDVRAKPHNPTCPQNHHVPLSQA